METISLPQEYMCTMTTKEAALRILAAQDLDMVKFDTLERQGNRIVGITTVTGFDDFEKYNTNLRTYGVLPKPRVRS